MGMDHGTKEVSLIETADILQASQDWTSFDDALGIAHTRLLLAQSVGSFANEYDKLVQTAPSPVSLSRHPLARRMCLVIHLLAWLYVEKLKKTKGENWETASATQHTC